MDVSQQQIDEVLKTANLPVSKVVQSLGTGELNTSYKVTVEDGRQFCIRIAKFQNTNLQREADALGRVPANIGPEVVYFQEESKPLDTPWIIETLLPGATPSRLNIGQFQSLGAKLAQVHAVSAPDHDVVDPGELSNPVLSQLWPYLVWCCKGMYSEDQLLNNLPDSRLQAIMQKAKPWLEARQASMGQVEKRLLHRDITPSNMLTDGDEVFLVDWELRGYGDPMSEFSTGIWDDTELNRGKWRIVLTDAEQQALYDSYQQAGGQIDENRIQTWITHDKLGVAVFLCYRLNSPLDGVTPERTAQYQEDFDRVRDSLERVFG